MIQKDTNRSSVRVAKEYRIVVSGLIRDGRRETAIGIDYDGAGDQQKDGGAAADAKWFECEDASNKRQSQAGNP
jgi:hypothetical protein